MRVRAKNHRIFNQLEKMPQLIFRSQNRTRSRWFPEQIFIVAPRRAVTEQNILKEGRLRRSRQPLALIGSKRGPLARECAGRINLVRLHQPTITVALHTLTGNLTDQRSRPMQIEWAVEIVSQVDDGGNGSRANI